MKTKIAAAVLFAACMTMIPRPAEAGVSVSIAFFHEELAPYGRWVYTPAYGEIWYPTVVAAGWAPYVDGEWVYTDCGWTWVSYDPFSDPFHYGTWVWADPYGWSWVPGYVWGPAWVTWAWTDGYVGWAPLPPTFVITTGGYYGAPVSVATNQYVFVPANQFVGTNVSTIRVAPTQNTTILAGAQRATRFSVSGGLVRAGGPSTSFVQRATGRPVHAVKVSSVKVRPATISASKGAKLPIVAPAKERAAAMKESKPAKTAPSKIAHNERATTGKHVEKKMEPTHVTKTEKHAATRTEKHAAPAPASVKHEAKPSQTRAKTSTAVAGPPPKKEIHHEKSSSGPPPARSVEKRQEAAPQPRAHEEHRAAMNRPAEQPHPARQEAPPPRAEQPHPAPPPAAAAKPPEHPQPQGQGKGPKKEKGQQ